jgi:hypothetical protein
LLGLIDVVRAKTAYKRKKCIFCLFLSLRQTVS